PLPDPPLPVEHVAHRADAVAGFALLDLAHPLAMDPDRVIVEITDDFPDLAGRLLEHGAVIGLGHGRSPGCRDGSPSSASRGCEPTRYQMERRGRQAIDFCWPTAIYCA